MSIPLQNMLDYLVNVSAFRQKLLRNDQIISKMLHPYCIYLNSLKYKQIIFGHFKEKRQISDPN